MRFRQGRHWEHWACGVIQDAFTFSLHGPTLTSANLTFTACVATRLVIPHESMIIFGKSRNRPHNMPTILTGSQNTHSLIRITRNASIVQNGSSKSTQGCRKLTIESPNS